MSSRLSAATSPARSPSRASSVSIAKSRRPTAVCRSQLASSAATWPGSSACGSPASRQLATDGHRCRQRLADQPLDVQEAQQRPQRGHHQLRRARRHAADTRPARTPSPRPPSARQAEPAVAPPARPGTAAPFRIATGGPGGQAALGHQIAPIALQQPLRRRRRSRRPAPAPRPAAAGSPAAAPAPSATHRLTSSAPAGQEPLRHLRRQPRRIQPLSIQPPAQMRHQPQLTAAAFGVYPSRASSASEPRRERPSGPVTRTRDGSSHRSPSLSRSRRGECRSAHRIMPTFPPLSGRHQQLPPPGRHNPEVGVMDVMPTSA